MRWSRAGVGRLAAHSGAESTTDFTPLVTTAKYERPEVIFIAGVYEQAALITKACKKAGLIK